MWPRPRGVKPAPAPHVPQKGSTPAVKLICSQVAADSGVRSREQSCLPVSAPIWLPEHLSCPNWGQHNVFLPIPGGHTTCSSAGIPLLLGCVMFMFSFVWNCQTVFQRDCTILHFTSNTREFPSFHTHRRWLLSTIFLTATLVGECQLISQLVSSCIFDSHFPNDSWCWTSFHVRMIIYIFLWWDAY